MKRQEQSFCGKEGSVTYGWNDIFPREECKLLYRPFFSVRIACILCNLWAFFKNNNINLKLILKLKIIYNEKINSLYYWKLDSELYPLRIL